MFLMLLIRVISLELVAIFFTYFIRRDETEITNSTHFMSQYNSQSSKDGIVKKYPFNAYEVCPLILCQCLDTPNQARTEFCAKQPACV